VPQRRSYTTPKQNVSTTYDDLALSRGNIGFDMLMRLGYTPGLPLGADSTPGALVEPLGVTVKVCRGGLGRAPPPPRRDVRAKVKAEAADYASVSALVGDIYKPRCRWCGWAGTAGGGRKLYRHERRCASSGSRGSVDALAAAVTGGAMDVDDDDCGSSSGWSGGSPTGVLDVDFGGREDDAASSHGSDSTLGLPLPMPAALPMDFHVDVDAPFEPLRR